MSIDFLVHFHWHKLCVKRRQGGNFCILSIFKTFSNFFQKDLGLVRKMARADINFAHNGSPVQNSSSCLALPFSFWGGSLHYGQKCIFTNCLKCQKVSLAPRIEILENGYCDFCHLGGPKIPIRFWPSYNRPL